MSDDGFISAVTGALSRALTPLVAATSSPGALGAVLTRLGWATTPTVDALREIAAATSGLGRLASDVAVGASGATLVADVASAIEALASLQRVTPSAGAPFDDPGFWTALPEELLALLVFDDLQANAPRLYGVLAFLGALRMEARPADLSAGRLAYVAHVFDWAALARLATSPATWAADVYGWGGPFDHARLLQATAALGAGLGGAFSLQAPHASVLAPYIADDNPARGAVQMLSVTPFVIDPPTLAASIKPALVVLPLPPAGKRSGAPEGLLLWPMLTGAAAATVDLGSGATLSLSGDLQASPLHVEIRPSGTTIGGAAASFAASARVDVAPAAPFVMGGSSSGARFELSRAHLSLDVAGSQVSIEAALDDAAAILDLGEADGFLSSMLGSAPQQLSLSAGLAWSSAAGLSFSGSALPSVHIATDLVVAKVLTISELDIELGADGDAAQLVVSATGGLVLGPLAIVVDRVGVAVTATPATLAAPGNFGLLDVALGFKPPDGLGISVDAAGVVSGGGYLAFDADAGEYSGAAALGFAGMSLTAIGVLATKMPDGSAGWSMYLSLAARFVGVELGFGFTLNGVGGLVGIQRGLDADALADGVRSGSLDRLLFPDDPVAQAPQILADIEAIFPRATGQYVFGPVVAIGWGTPTLVEVDLGVVLQLPEPLTISLLGSLSAVLPTSDVPVLQLRVDVAGTLDFTAGTLKIDASLRDSRVLALELSGDMAVRASFLDDPAFLLAFGGFHPDFVPPDDFPKLDRLAIGLDTGDDLRITLDGYVALTSNTAQLGAAFSLWAKALGFTLEGGSSFDALVTFDPFGFVIDIAMWVSVKAGSFDLLGVALGGKLSGPNPWHVAGSATFKFLGVSKTVPVQATIGSPEAEGPRPTVALADLLIAELGRPDAWGAVAPDGDGALVVLGTLAADAVAVHPAGRVQVRQRLVPLDTRIDHYGAATVAGAATFSLASPKLGGHALVGAAVETATDWFAAAQYFDLSDAEKLSAPSFAQMPAGLVLGDGSVSGGPEAVFTYDHEVIYRDPAVQPAGDATAATLYTATAATLDRAIALGTATAVRTASRLPRSTRATSPFAVAEPAFVVADAMTGAVAAAGPRQGTGFYAARDACGAAQVVVPSYEAHG